ncbi:MAG: TonB-dependent receptor [Bacteroidales bacterium]|nr:TonB-dependent receptor [Bacteroidales bacterium]
MKNFLIAIYSVVMFNATAVAQTISGNVKNAGGEGVPFANVVLLQNDTIFLSGTITDENGKFVFADTQNANLIKISCIGYTDFSKKISESETVINAVLEESDVNLDEIEITARRQLTQIKNGAMVTKVENSLLSKEGTASDVLAKLPGVMKKGEGIEVFGRGAPEIYINNRKVQDENELSQLNSENIKNVQVIRNPGAKYSAETNAVIIITTIDSVGEGVSFDVKNNNTIGKYYSSGNTLNLNFRKRKLDVFANLSFDYSKQMSGSECKQTTFADTIWTFNDTETGNNLLKAHNFMAKGGFNYQINENNSLGIFYQRDLSDSKLYSRSGLDVFANDVLFDFTKMNSTSRNKTNPKNSVNFYYTGQASDLGIDFNFDFMSSQKRNDYSGLETEKKFSNRNVTSQSNSDRRLIAEKLVLSYPILQGTFEFGNEYTNSYSKETYCNVEGYISDSDIKVRENNNAFFTEYSMEIGDDVEVAAGLRYEHIDFDYYVFGDKNAAKTYDEFFPSVSISAALGDVDLSLSYSGRTQRPAYYQLSSNVNYVDRYTYHGGNPLLKPSKSQDFEFQTVYNCVYFQGTYTVVKNPVLNYSKVYGNDPKVKLTTFENFDKISQYQLILGCQPSVGFWSATFNAGVLGQDFKVNYQNETKKMNSPMPLVEWYNNFSLPKDFVISLDCDYMGKGDYENVKMKPTFEMDFSVQKTFFDNALSIKLSVDDIFNTLAQKLTFYNEDISIYQKDLSETRFVSLTIKYRFNPAKSKYKGTGAGNEEKERM